MPRHRRRRIARLRRKGLDSNGMPRKIIRGAEYSFMCWSEETKAPHLDASTEDLSPALTKEEYDKLPPKVREALEKLTYGYS